MRTRSQPLIESNRVVTVVSAANFHSLDDFEPDISAFRSATQEVLVFTDVKPELGLALFDALDEVEPFR